MRRILVLVAAMAAVIVAVPASAITDGEPDGGAHPYVGLAVFDTLQDHDDDPDTPDIAVPTHRCSGSLISETVFVTAGHCTFDTVGGRVYFQEDVDQFHPDGGTGEYPFPGPNSVEMASTHTHPEFENDAFFLFDVGVVILGEGGFDPGFFAQLPPQGVVDTLGRGRNNPDATITAVGYGLQEIVLNPVFGPVKLQDDLDRLKADLMIVDTQGVAGIGSLNPDQAFVLSGDAANGGTCFGDSGGPSLIFGTHTIVGVTSFGLNGNCAGIGGAYRIDQPDDLTFITGFLP